MISFSNFGSSRSTESDRVAEAVQIARTRWPDLEIDGEMQADMALNPSTRADRFPFSSIEGEANVLVFPSLDAAHIAVRLMGSIGEASVVGPILMGMQSPVNYIQPHASVEDIVNLSAITVLQAQKEY